MRYEEFGPSVCVCVCVCVCEGTHEWHDEWETHPNAMLVPAYSNGPGVSSFVKKLAKNPKTTT